MTRLAHAGHVLQSLAGGRSSLTVNPLAIGAWYLPRLTVRYVMLPVASRAWQSTLCCYSILPLVVCYEGGSITKFGGVTFEELVIDTGTRSSSCLTLSRPPVTSRRLFPNRAISITAPRLWNDLPPELRTISLPPPPSLPITRHHLHPPPVSVTPRAFH